MRRGGIRGRKKGDIRDKEGGTKGGGRDEGQWEGEEVEERKGGRGRKWRREREEGRAREERVRRRGGEGGLEGKGEGE